MLPGASAASGHVFFQACLLRTRMDEHASRGSIKPITYRAGVEDWASGARVAAAPLDTAAPRSSRGRSRGLSATRRQDTVRGQRERWECRRRRVAEEHKKEVGSRFWREYIDWMI